MSEYMKIALGN